MSFSKIVVEKEWLLITTENCEMNSKVWYCEKIPKGHINNKEWTFDNQNCYDYKSVLSAIEDGWELLAPPDRIVGSDMYGDPYLFEWRLVR